MANEPSSASSSTSTTSETVVHEEGTHRPTHTPHPATSQRPTTGPTTSPSSTRPTGFVRSPLNQSSSGILSGQEPESSNIGRFISIGVIVILVLLLIYQIASKAGLRGQVRSLEAENASLASQVESLQQNNTQSTSGAATITPSPAVSESPTALSLLTYPVLYRENAYQKIAQTISVTSAAKVSGVLLRGNAGKGSAGQVAIYESPNLGRLDDAKPLAKRAFDTSKIPSGQTFSVKFQKPIELKTGVGYLLVIETTKKDAEAQIGYRAATSTAPGSMWVYTRKISDSGQVITNDFSWQEIPGYDLFFELRGEE